MCAGCWPTMYVPCVRLLVDGGVCRGCGRVPGPSCMLMRAFVRKRLHEWPCVRVCVCVVDSVGVCVLGTGRARLQV